MTITLNTERPIAVSQTSQNDTPLEVEQSVIPSNLSNDSRPEPEQYLGNNTQKNKYIYRKITE